ncbi:hydrolase [Caballeronia temeraria]|uniref:Hydrolase n=1 Tax=Caballeronia temeraria TaxID=1777137 RepID=A0A158A3W7_9BURK|nr:HAD family phosphatase [Caballeronia temeraria]SAK52470.1 hydrolase [Caballeronia temeraria]
MTTVDISLVLFDMEGVLTHYDREARVAHLAATTHCTPDAVRHAIWGSGLEARADAGIIDDAEYLATLGAMLNYPLGKDEWLASRRASITPNERTLALAGQLQKSRAIAILTNNCHLVTDHLAYLNPAVDRLFGKAVYSSASFGATKPAPQTYVRCVEEIGARPSETLFIDDTEANVRGAVDAGLLGYTFDNAEALESEFERLGLL